MEHEDTITTRAALMAGAPLTTAEIAQMLGVSRQAVTMRMRRNEAEPLVGESAHGNAYSWKAEDYERVYPRLAAIRGAA